MYKLTPLGRLLIVVFLFSSFLSFAQQDSLRLRDSAVVVVDSAAIRDSLFNIARIQAEADSIYRMVLSEPTRQFDSLVYNNHPFYSFKDPIRRKLIERQWQGKEVYFYFIIGLLIFFALIKNAFPRYLQDIVRLFLRTTIKQRQIKEQLMQAPLPSLLLNILFVLSGGLYITLLRDHYNIAEEYPFWLIYVYACLALALIYLVKFVSLKIIGWIFRVSASTDAYIFIVFTTNKILGITLLLFIVLLSFTEGFVKSAALNLSFIVIVAFFLYRFILAFMAVHRDLKMEFIHFVLYLLAFEVVPLLLINKLLLSYLS